MNYIDLRDIIEQKNSEPQQYKAWKEAIEGEGYNFEDLAENEPTMIPAALFEDYAQELAEDIGAIDRQMRWPANHIDWEEAAEELKIDYSYVEVNGTTYYFRSY